MRQKCNNISFFLGEKSIKTVDQYKYLVVTCKDSLDFSSSAEVLVDTAWRALSASTTNTKHLNNPGYITYTVLCETQLYQFKTIAMQYGALNKLKTLMISKADYICFCSNTCTQRRNGLVQYLTNKIVEYVKILE